MKKLITNIILWYLRVSAKLQLLKIKPKIIALTGSVGKTSLRNAVFSVLKDNFKCKVSYKANSETGIPLDILGLYPKDYSFLDWLRLSLLVPVKLLTNWQKYQYYIVELGVDDPLPPKNMAYLLKFIKPDIAIFLNVAAVHTQQFEKIIHQNKKFNSYKEKQNFLLKAIASEKGKLITRLSSSKIAVVNGDDENVWEQAQKSKAKKYFFGKKGDLKIIDYQASLTGTEFAYIYQNQEIILKLPFLLPKYYCYTLAPAILTGIILGLDIGKAINSLQQNFKLPSGRMSVFKGIKNTTIIDSSYNASKASVLGALDLLSKLQGKKVFVFGDMRELGSQAKEEHQKIAQKILKTVNELILIGPLTKKYVLAVVSGKIKTKWFLNSWQTADWLKNCLKGGELILIKGSQNTIFTEIVVKALLKNPKDQVKLCRRGKFWDKQREMLK